MKRLLTAIFAAALCLSAGAVTAQNTNTSMANVNTTKKRGPVFRATKEQIKQAQVILKQRSFYAGEPTRTLDTPPGEGPGPRVPRQEGADKAGASNPKAALLFRGGTQGQTRQADARRRVEF